MGIFDFLNATKKKTDSPVSPLLPEQVYKVAEMQLRDIIAPSALGIQPKSLNLGTNVVRSYFVISYPRYLTDNWLSPLINLDKIFDVSIHVTPLDSAEVMKGFQRKVAEVESQRMVRDEKGQVRDPALDVAYEDLEDLRDGLTQGQERMFEVSLYISIYGSTEEEVNKVENEIKNILESRLVYVKPALFQQDVAFLSTLPLGQDLLQIKNKLNTSPLSSFFPFVSSDLSSDKGILYGLNRHNGSLILFDRFSLENYNSIVFAKSGSGKSYTTKLEILRTLMFDTEVIIIDPEREYEYLAESVGGRYFDISLTSDHHINPFDLPHPTEDESPSEVLRSNIVNLVGLFRVMLGGLTPEEDAIIDQAITETYALKDISGDADFTKLEPPLLSDFETVLGGIEGSEDIIQRLSKYTRGTWSGFINQPSNVDINKKLVCFSIRDMEDELKPVAMYIVTHYIWNSVRKDIRKRLLVVDEAWIMMKNDDTASFLFGLAKRGRKYYLGLATITQDVGDFLKSPYGLPIITNSSIQLLLKQSPSSIDIVQKTFNLTDEEKYLLLESGVGEGIFFAGLKHVAIKVVASYTEDQIITSDPSQLLQIKEMKQEVAESQEGTKKI
jgi:type IV secretory pathway VirB4 component